MRKRILLLSLLLPILFFGSFAVALGEGGDETTATLEQETADISSTLPNPGLTPDHPLYFLDTLGENIGLFLTRSPEGKAEKAFSYAEEKLAEAKSTADKGKDKATEKAVGRYGGYVGKATENLGKAKALGRDIGALAEKVSEATLKHQAVLSGVYDKLLAKGNEKAAEAVLKAMEGAMNGHETALQAISNAQRKSEIEAKGKRVKEAVETKTKGPGRPQE